MVLGASKNNTLYQRSAGDFSNGAGDSFFAGEVGPMGASALRRGLIAFDIADNIPAGSTINSVTLDLHMTQTVSGAETVELRDVMADWGEGTSNADAQPGIGVTATTNDATWVYRFFNTTSTWTSTGGDYSTTASASTSVGSIGDYTWGSTAQMVADVQNWLDHPSNNFGWLVLGNETTSGSAKRFASRHDPTTSNQPTLTIDYTTSATASSLAVTDFPSTVTAGDAGTVTVTAQDAMGNTFTGYTGTVHFTSSDPQVSAGTGLPADYTFTPTDAGVHVFNVMLTAAGTQSITVTDTASTSITGTQSGITVNPAAADHLAITGPPSAASGEAFDITVMVLDAYNNVVVGYTGTITFMSSDSAPMLPPDYTFTADDMGSHTFTAETTLFDVNPMATITAQDTGDSNIQGTLTLSIQ
jgi:hypothetical protein